MISRLAFLVVLVAAVANAQGFGFMSKEEQQRQAAQVRRWTHAYYPALMREKELPNELVFAFLVNRKGEVIRHTVGFDTHEEGATVPTTLERLFGGGLPKMNGHGAALIWATATEPGYWVYYGIAK